MFIKETLFMLSFFFFLIGNKRTIINKKKKKNTSCSWWWTIRNRRNKQTNEGKGNQIDNLRENKNSRRDGDSVKPQQQDHSKRLRWLKTFNSSKVSPYSQRSDNSVPTKQSTLCILESNSKYLSCASRAADTNKTTIPSPILAWPNESQKPKAWKSIRSV